MCKGIWQMNIKKQTFIVIALLALAGCATQAPRQDQIKSVPADRAMAYQSPDDGDATIIVTRDVGFSGKGCTAVIFVDGKESAMLETGERVTFHVPSGSRIIGSWPRGALCGRDDNRVETDATIKPGEVRKFRVGGSGNGITPTTT